MSLAASKSPKSPQLREAREDFLREHCQVGDGVVVVEEAALPHHQEVAEAADVVVHLLDLPKHLIGRAGEHDAGLDGLVDGGIRPVRGVLVDCDAAQNLGVHRGRHIARRIAEMQRHFVGRHVPEELLGAGARLRFALAGIEQRRIGEAIDRHIGATPGLAPALAVGIVDRGRPAARAKIVILDITGVKQVDGGVASSLLRTAAALRLLGAQVVLSGVRPEVAILTLVPGYWPVLASARVEAPALDSIHMVDALAGWAVTVTREPSVNELLRTTDGGLQWTDVTPPDSSRQKIRVGHLAVLNSLIAWVESTDTSNLCHLAPVRTRATHRVDGCEVNGSEDDYQG